MIKTILALLVIPVGAHADPAPDPDEFPGVPADGWRLDARLGGSDHKDNDLPDGYGLGIMIGRERVHDRTGITKGVALELSGYDYMGAAGDYRETNVFGLAMIRAAYHGTTFRWHASAGLGLGHEALTDPRFGDSGHTMLALSLSVGFAYKITDATTIGPVIEYKPCVDFDFNPNQYWDLGLAATFGL